MHPQPNGDVAETDLDEQQGMALLQLSFARLDALTARADASRALPTTALAGDDAATPYSPLSSQVNTAMAVATDHLMGLRVGVEDSNGKIMAFAWWTLIRSAYETAGNALWLMSPPGRDDRVLRSLQLTHDARRSVNTTTLELELQDAGFDRMEARMRQLRDARPGINGRTLSLTTLTKRMKAINLLVPEAFLPPSVLWSMCSGIAHGNASMFLSMLERKRVTPAINGVSEHLLTTSVALLALFYSSALEMVEAALNLFDSRNRPLATKRPLTWMDWPHAVLDGEIRALLPRAACGDSEHSSL